MLRPLIKFLRDNYNEGSQRVSLKNNNIILAYLSYTHLIGAIEFLSVKNAL